MKRVWALTLLCSLWMQVGFGHDPIRPDLDLWTDSVFNTLTLEEQVGQLIELQVFVTQDNLAYYKEILSKYPIGHLQVLGGHPAAFLQLIRFVQAKTKIPLIVSFLNYNGVGIPLDSVHEYAKYPTIGRIDDPGILRSIANELAIQSRALQINSYNTSLASINVDAFGISTNIKGPCEENERCEGNLVQLLTPLIEEDIMVSLDVNIDFKDSREALERYWNVDFWRSVSKNPDKRVSELIKREQTGITLRVKRLPFINDGDENGFRRRFFTPLITKSMNHSGLIVLDIHALSKIPAWSNEEMGAVKGLEIGAHIVSIHDDIDTTFQQISKFFSPKGMRSLLLREKVNKVLRTKNEVYVEKEYLPDVSNLFRILNRPEAQLISNRIFKNVLRVDEAAGKRLPIREVAHKYFASLSIGTGPESQFKPALDRYAPFVHFDIPAFSYDPYKFNILKSELASFDYVIIALHTFEYAYIDQRFVQLINELQQKTTVMLVFLGYPSNADDFDRSCTRIFASEDNHITQDLVPELIFGAFTKEMITQEIFLEHSVTEPKPSEVFRISSRLPEEQQMDSWTLDKIDDIVRQAIQMQAMPGCQVVVARNGSVVFNRNYGHYMYDSSMIVTPSAIYDLASITKIAATTQALMYLYDQKKLVLEKELGDYLPELRGTNKEHLVIKDVLTHQSGLRSFLPFWQYTIRKQLEDSIQFYNDRQTDHNSNEVAFGVYSEEWLKDSLWQWTIDSKLRRKYRNTRYNYRYSDLGFYIMQVLAERLLERPLDVFLDSAFYKPMGMRSMTFKPLCKYPMNAMVPTELDTVFRDGLLWGNVHDPIAAMYGGVAGHAGLFSSATDLVKLMQMNLQGGRYGGQTYLSREVVEKFTSKQFAGNRRGLGWDKPEREKTSSPASRYSSAAAFGHSGFTGTVVWVDPTFNLIFVFLSNRVYPNANNRKLNRYNVRRRIHDLVYESMWNFQVFTN